MLEFLTGVVVGIGLFGLIFYIQHRRSATKFDTNSTKYTKIWENFEEGGEEDVLEKGLQLPNTNFMPGGDDDDDDDDDDAMELVNLKEMDPKEEKAKAEIARLKAELKSVRDQFDKETKALRGDMDSKETARQLALQEVKRLTHELMTKDNEIDVLKTNSPTLTNKNKVVVPALKPPGTEGATKAGESRDSNAGEKKSGFASMFGFGSGGSSGSVTGSDNKQSTPPAKDTATGGTSVTTPPLQPVPAPTAAVPAAVAAVTTKTSPAMASVQPPPSSASADTQPPVAALKPNFAAAAVTNGIGHSGGLGLGGKTPASGTDASKAAPGVVAAPGLNILSAAAAGAAWDNADDGFDAWGDDPEFAEDWQDELADSM
eukprot:GFYU01002860.1.p1 GENE.GFYU01002860.1~~GFYU01002860.1.p1  ORF type:complete len:373 (-),score=102.07 GFYU01002860.1:178-1296(-)